MKTLYFTLLCAAAMLFATAAGAVAEADESPPNTGPPETELNIELNDNFATQITGTLDHGTLGITDTVVVDQGVDPPTAVGQAISANFATLPNLNDERLRNSTGDPDGASVQHIPLLDTPPPPNAADIDDAVRKVCARYCKSTLNANCDYVNCSCHDPTNRLTAIFQRKTQPPSP